MSLYWNDEFDYFNILGKKIGNDFVLVRKLFVQFNDGQVSWELDFGKPQMLICIFPLVSFE